MHIHEITVEYTTKSGRRGSLDPQEIILVEEAGEAGSVIMLRNGSEIEVSDSTRAIKGRWLKTLTQRIQWEEYLKCTAEDTTRE